MEWSYPLRPGRPPSPRFLRHPSLTEALTTIRTASHGIRRGHAELNHGHGISPGHGTVTPLVQRAGPEAPPGKHRPQPPARPTGTSPEPPRTNRGSPTSPSTPPERARSTAQSSRRPAHAGSSAGPSTPPGPPPSRPAPRTRRSAAGVRTPGPWSTPATESKRFASRAFTERARTSGPNPSTGTIGDCYGNAVIGLVPGPDADRTARPPQMAHPPGTGRRALRVPRDPPRPTTPAPRARHAHTHRVQAEGAPQVARSPATRPQVSRGRSTRSRRSQQHRPLRERPDRENDAARHAVTDAHPLAPNRHIAVRQREQRSCELSSPRSQECRCGRPRRARCLPPG